MKLLQLHVPDEVASRIEEAAQVRGITIVQLLQESVEERIQRDAEFSQTIDRVIGKNAELYRRLS